MSEIKMDFAIIGSGIIGLQVAYALLKRGYAPDSMAIFESHPFPGEHSSSRNSGVLHAGLYYPENSLKQKFCLEGNQMWEVVARELKIPLSRVGKYVVASSSEEIEDLEKLFTAAKSKNVPGLEWVTHQNIEDYVHCKKAFFSASTGIIDVSSAIKNLVNYVERNGVPLLLSQAVDGIDKIGEEFDLWVQGEKITSTHVINCAGLSAVTLRAHLGLNDFESYWVKGRYLKLKKKYYNQSLIYPLPPADLKGLGVHTSFDSDGVIRFGPDTVETSVINYGLEEECLNQMYPSILKIFKGIEKEDLSLDYSGIRSKIKKNGEIYPDFWIKSPLKNYVECLGIESPGLTASPAIAQEVLRILGL